MEPGVEIATFCSIDDLCEKVDYFLNHEDEVKMLITRGKKRILNEHTIQHRMHEMLIHVFMEKLSELKSRVSSSHRDSVRHYIDYVGESSPLGVYLNKFIGTNNFSIKTMVDHISVGEGLLSQEELLVLMTDQIVTSNK